MKILVTGANGYLGKRLCAYYEDKYEIIRAYREDMNIENIKSVREFLWMHKPDIVIHCAGLSDTAECEENPSKSYRINVTGTKNVSIVCHEINCKLIYCSSDQVYTTYFQTQPHLEAEALFPQTVYGKHKLEAEKICLKQHYKVVILRMAWLYDSMMIYPGDHPDLYTILLDAKQKNEPRYFSIHDFRSITSVYEAVKNFEKTFDLPGGIYNYGVETKKNTYETISDVAPLFGVPRALIRACPHSFKDNPRNISMDIKKIKMYGIDF